MKEHIYICVIVGEKETDKGTNQVMGLYRVRAVSYQEAQGIAIFQYGIKNPEHTRICMRIARRFAEMEQINIDRAVNNARPQ